MRELFPRESTPARRSLPEGTKLLLLVDEPQPEVELDEGDLKALDEAITAAREGKLISWETSGHRYAASDPRMTRYRIVLLLRAAAEIDQITQITKWWRKNRPAAPRLFLDEWDRTFATIADHPEIGRKFYNVDVDAGVVAVARVRHGKRRPLAR